MKRVFNIKGMTCNSCANHIEEALKDKVNNVEASFSRGDVFVDFDSEKVSEGEIKDIIKDTGYDVEESSENKLVVIDDKVHPKKTGGKGGWIILTFSSVLLIYLLYSLFGSSLQSLDFDFSSLENNASLFLLFFAGLLTGFHCVSMCGGFIVSYTAKNALEGHKSFLQHVIYGGSKTISYTIIGGLFGLIGSFFVFSPTLRGGIAIFAGIFMIFYSFSMMGFGFFRRFQFNPKFLRNISGKKYSGVYFGPMMTGLLTGLFIACGPLQALYIYAAGTANPIQGGLSLMVFSLGTLPVLLGFGGLTNVISHKATKKILKVSAVIVLILGLIMLNRGLALTGSGYDFKSIVASKSLDATGNFIDSEGYQVIEMDVTRYGYEPDNFVLHKGVPVKWVIDGKELTGCNRAIQVPKLDLSFDIEKGKQTIEFTPEEEGVISWSCWMGMIPGTFVVTSNGSASQDQIQEASKQAVPKGGGCGCGGGGGNVCGV